MEDATEEWRALSRSLDNGAVGQFCLSDLNVGEMLGRGAFASVYQVSVDGCKLAMKKYRKSDWREIHNELKTMIKFSEHENLMQIRGLLYASTQDRDEQMLPIGYIMEYMSGGSLSDVIHSHQNNYDDKQILSWTEQTASALNYLHENRIIHRNVKPSIMLGNEDFTVLKLGSLDMSTDFKPMQTATVGTFEYMAPEVMSYMEDEVPYNEKCDVYSLGISIWEMYHRKVVWPTHNVFFHLMKTIEGERPEISEDCDPGIAEMIRRSWSPNVEQRPSMQEIHSMCVEMLNKPKLQAGAHIHIARHPQRDMEDEHVLLKWREFRSSLISGSQAADGVKEVCSSELKGLEFIGEGSQAVVRRAHMDGCEWAIKRYKKITWREIYIELVTILTFSKHDNLMKIWALLYDSPQHRDEQMLPIGYIMEYMSGGSLYEVIHDQDGLPYNLAMILMWTKQAASALHYLHTNHIIHRDVKPANMFLDGDFNVLKLGDFGTSTTDRKKMTATIGTLPYMAPEILSEETNVKYNNTIDVYSLSISLWEMCFRKEPYDGRNVLQFSSKIRAGERPDCTKYMDQQSAESDMFAPIHDQQLIELIHRGWSANVDERPSMEEICSFTSKKLEELAGTEQQPCSKKIRLL